MGHGRTPLPWEAGELQDRVPTVQYPCQNPGSSGLPSTTDPPGFHTLLPPPQRHLHSSPAQLLALPRAPSRLCCSLMHVSSQSLSSHAKLTLSIISRDVSVHVAKCDVLCSGKVRKQAGREWVKRWVCLMQEKRDVEGGIGCGN